MPTKNIAASNTAITPSFRGGPSLRICLSKKFLVASVHFDVPNFVRAKRGKPAAVPLTVAELTLSSLIGGAYPWLMVALAIKFKTIKHQSAQGCGEQGSVSRLAQTGPEQALSSLVWIMREGANAVPDDGERFRSLRAVCLVAHQRTAWGMPERTISGARRIATPLAQACQEVTGGRRQS
jgi:hypothetical protein